MISIRVISGVDPSDFRLVGKGAPYPVSKLTPGDQAWEDWFVGCSRIPFTLDRDVLVDPEPTAPCTTVKFRYFLQGEKYGAITSSAIPHEDACRIAKSTGVLVQYQTRRTQRSDEYQGWVAVTPTGTAAA